MQTITDLSTQNEVEIGTELQDESQLNMNRAAMEQVLATTFGQPGKRQARSQQRRPRRKLPTASAIRCRKPELA